MIEDYDNIEIKRLKEKGVFYTPDHITDFICRNTIIPYLSREGADNIYDLISEYHEDIGKLERKLKSIKILDPACGCGVFLTKAVELLFEIAKGIRLIKDLGNKYEKIMVEKPDTSKGIQFNSDIGIDKEETRQIIENSIYGVDINEESTELTKLSLYSKIEKKDRKLIDLSRNIKCGDSLIDDPSLRDRKAFHWSQNFEKILRGGGFDIIIGNPPYINVIEDLKSKKYYKERYSEIYTGKNDIYYYFFQKAIELSKNDGYISFISPRYLMEAFEARKLREYILKETAIQKIIDFLDFRIFEDANIDTAIYILKKSYRKHEIRVYKLVNEIDPPLKLEPSFFKSFRINQNLLTGKKWYFIDPVIQTILDKIENRSTGRLKDYSVISKGIQTGKDSVFVITKDIVEKYSIEKHTLRNWLKSSQISRFSPIDPQLFVIISNRKITKELSSFPNLEKYLYENKEELLKRARVSKWYHWRKGDERFTIDWNRPKIITPYKSAYNNFTIDDRGCYFSQDIVLVFPIEEVGIHYLLAYLNSKLCEFYFKIKGKRLGAVYEYYPRQIEELPFIKIKMDEQKAFAWRVDRLFKLNSLLSEHYIAIQNRIMSEFNIEYLNKNLQKFKEKHIKKILNEIEKLRESRFSSMQKEKTKIFISNRLIIINSLKEEIYQTEKELDHLIYLLFDLKGEEIRLIE